MLGLALPLSTQVHAHGGLSLADDICKLTIGPYTMHFTGYQPESHPGERILRRHSGHRPHRRSAGLH